MLRLLPARVGLAEGLHGSWVGQRFLVVGEVAVLRQPGVYGRRAPLGPVMVGSGLDRKGKTQVTD